MTPEELLGTVKHHLAEQGLDELADELEAFIGSKLPGPRGAFPFGKLNSTDEGALRMAMTVDKGRLIISFGKPTEWIGFDKESAAKFADYVRTKIPELK